MDWTPENVEKLKELWAVGLSITQIGHRLGITRNAVVGKAHRIGLSRRAAVMAKRAAPAASGAAAPAASAAMAPAGRIEAVTGNLPCKWPIGDPKSPDFHFCGAAALLNRPYCGAHCAEAYATWEGVARADKAANAA